MKKSLIALSLTALLFSCKKETTPAALSPTDLTGTGHVRGNASKNIVTPNGTGGWNTNSRVPAQGVNVTIRVAKGGGAGLYTNSSAQGSDVYTGQTDANGNYDITIKTNGVGVTANIIIDGFTGTLDTIVNGARRTGLYANFVGTNNTRTVYSNQTAWLDHAFNAANLSSNPNNFTTGTGIVSGSVSLNIVRKATTTTGTVVTVAFGSTNIPVPAGTKVYLDFNMDPLNLVTKSYQTTTDAAGNYSFSLVTVALNTPGFNNQTATVWVADLPKTRDTLAVSITGTNNPVNTGTITGVQGVYDNQTTTQTGVYNNEIKNATNLNYGAGSFTPN